MVSLPFPTCPPLVGWQVTGQDSMGMERHTQLSSPTSPVDVTRSPPGILKLLLFFRNPACPQNPVFLCF